MKTSLGRIILCCAGLAAAVLVLSASNCPPGQGGGSDDDRPPIIISGGSVDLRVVAKTRGQGYNYDRGKWVQNGTQWYHDHGKKPGTHLLINVVYGTGDDHCDDPEWDFDYTEFKITYGAPGMGGNGSFRVFMDMDPGLSAAQKGRLTVDSQAANLDPNPKLPFWLLVGESTDQPKSVVFPPYDNPKTTCTFADGTKGQVQVHQVRH